MAPEQARALAQFINDHDPRHRARVEEREGGHGCVVQCYERVENGGSGEDAAAYDTVERYVEEARRDSPDPASTFSLQLERWLANHDRA